MAVRHEITIARACKRDVGILLQETNDFSGDHGVTGYEIHSSGVKRREITPGSELLRLGSAVLWFWVRGRAWLQGASFFWWSAEPRTEPRTQNQNQNPAPSTQHPEPLRCGTDKHRGASRRLERESIQESSHIANR